MASADMEIARATANNSRVVFAEAKRDLDNANAVVLALILLEEHATKWPGITGYYYEVENEYNDEEYYNQAYIRVAVDDMIEGHGEAVAELGEPFEDYDCLETWDEDTCTALFSFQQDTFSLDQLRTRVVQLSSGMLGSDPNS